MYKISNSLTRQYINEMFHMRPLNDTLQPLRSSGTINYVLPKPNKELFKHSLIYTGPVMWNDLPDKLKHLETIDSFHMDERSPVMKYMYILYTFFFPCIVVVVVALLFYVHGEHLRSCRDGQLT